jgi:glutamate 5-kinase
MAAPFQKLVVKVGTNVLTRDDGRLDVTSISHLVDQLAALIQQGISVILVSSGAVGAGREFVPQADSFDPVVRRQVLASLGQVRLMELYRQLLGGHGLLCAQVLATKGDFSDRTHYLNMRNCFEALLADPRIVPIVNENDVVSVTELMFTDNDELASLVTGMINADALVILSSVDGLYSGPPDEPGSQLIPEVDAADEEALAHIAPIRSAFGRGGMATKLRMAQQTARLGADVYLAHGRRPDILTQIAAGNFTGTRVRARRRASSVKKWLAQGVSAWKGSVHINEGALRALRGGERVSSLLPVGVTAIEGDFGKGELVRLLAPDGAVAGYGLTQYAAAEARENMGRQGARALIHYDYLALV